MAATQQSCASTDDGSTAPAPTPPPALTLADICFLAFTTVILLAVVWLGHLAYMEGMKTEVTKANGEAWAKWFTEASPKRFMPNFSPAACSGVALQATPAGANGKSVGDVNKTAADANANLAPSPTWGECLEALTQDGAQFAGLRNPFAGKPLALAAKCDSSNRTLAGTLVLEKLTPTPPGSAVSSTASPLTGADVIEQKLQLRVTVCDKGAYPIRIAELDF